MSWELGKSTGPGRSGRYNRLFVKVMLWIVRTASPGRNLAAVFGNWSTPFRRFRDWRNADVFERIFNVLSGDPDMEYAMVDAMIVKVYRHARAQKEGKPWVARKTA